MSKYIHPARRPSPYQKRNPVGLFDLIMLRESTILPENYFTRNAQKAIVCDSNRIVRQSKKIEGPKKCSVFYQEESSWEVDMTVARFSPSEWPTPSTWSSPSPLVMFDMKHESIRRLPFRFTEVDTMLPADTIRLPVGGILHSSRQLLIVQAFYVFTPPTFLEPGYPREFQLIITKPGAIYKADRNGKVWETMYISHRSPIQDAYLFEEDNRLILVGDVPSETKAQAGQDIHVFELFPLKILVKFHLPIQMDKFAGKTALFGSTFFATEASDHHIGFYDLETVLKPPVLIRRSMLSVFPYGFPMNANIVQKCKSVRKVYVPTNNVVNNCTESRDRDTNGNTANDKVVFRGSKLYSVLNDAKMQVAVYKWLSKEPYPDNEEHTFMFFNVDIARSSGKPSMQKIYEVTAMVVEAYTEAANAFIILSTSEIRVVRFDSDTLDAELLFSWSLAPDATAIGQVVFNHFGRPIYRRPDPDGLSRLLGFTVCEEIRLLCLLLRQKNDCGVMCRIVRFHDLFTFELHREETLSLDWNHEDRDPDMEYATLHHGMLLYRCTYDHPNSAHRTMFEDTLFEFCEGEHVPRLVSANLVDLLEMNRDFFP